jgi:hypothetical protein
VLQVGEQMDRGKNFMACLRGAVNGGAEKEKDRVLHENILDGQDPCFFWAVLRLAAFACPFAFLLFMRFCQPCS